MVDILRLQVDNLHRDLCIQESASARVERKKDAAHVYRIPSSHRMGQGAQPDFTAGPTESRVVLNVCYSFRVEVEVTSLFNRFFLHAI